MMLQVLSWFAGFWPRVALVAAAFAAVVAWRAHDISSIRAAERERIAAAAQKAGTRYADTADKAHTAARKPGALERLRRDPRTCPDCN